MLDLISSRREFLKYTLFSSLTLLGGFTGCLSQKREEEPKPIEDEVKEKRNLFERDGKVLLSKLSFSENLKKSIHKTVSMIGGFEKLVAKGDSILLKPNFNSADPPPASSDPEFVKAVIELLFEYGASEVVIGESSGPGPSTRKVFGITGMYEIAKKAGAEILFFDEEEWVDVEIGGNYLKKIGISKEFFSFDKVVYTCCLKTHFLADFTMSLKLLVGFTRPSDRRMLHLRKLREKIVDLNTLIHPDLILLDARKCFITGGPAKGEVRVPNLILACGDRIALDVEGIKIIKSFPGSNLKKDPWEYTQIRRALELSLGVSSEEEYEVLEG